jgi:hypothetical protein
MNLQKERVTTKIKKEIINNLKRIFVIFLTLIAGNGVFSQNLNRINENKNDSIFLDTIFCGNYKFISELISKTEFDNLKSNSKTTFYLPSSTSRIAEGKCEYVNRINNDSILLKLKDGSLKWIVNSPGGKTGMSFVGNKFIDYIDIINQFLFIQNGWEWDHYSLIDNSSGFIDKTSLLQTLSIDTIYKMALTTRYDGFAFLGGGFKLYKIENKKLIEICELKEADSYTNDYAWSISDSYWIGQNEFIYIQNYLNRRVSSGEKKWFLKMKIEHIE